MPQEIQVSLLSLFSWYWGWKKGMGRVEGNEEERAQRAEVGREGAMEVVEGGASLGGR